MILGEPGNQIIYPCRPYLLALLSGTSSRNQLLLTAMDPNFVPRNGKAACMDDWLGRNHEDSQRFQYFHRSPVRITWRARKPIGFGGRLHYVVCHLTKILGLTGSCRLLFRLSNRNVEDQSQVVVASCHARRAKITNSYFRSETTHFLARSQKPPGAALDSSFSEGCLHSGQSVRVPKGFGAE